jgi:F-type H+-transporting ATPase subunit delta
MMLSQEVAQKYARALFLSVKQKNLLDQADEQFMALKTLLEKDHTLVNFLAAPQVTDEKKFALIKTVFESRLERPFLEFLLIVIEKRRINFLPAIVDEFDRLVKAAKGIAQVTVTTAVALTKSEELALNDKLVKKTGMKIELEKIIDPNILGGMIIVMHDQIIDGSIRHGLNQIEEQLGKVKVA